MLVTRHVASLALTLGILWWLLSGHTQILLLGLGLASVLLTLVLALRLDIVDHESQPLAISHRLIPYWLWLALEIIKSNFLVIRHILNPGLTISPTVVSLRCPCQTDIGKTIFANSVTLTPGTVTLDVADRSIRVHALTRDIATTLENGDMARRIPEPIRQEQP
jgi:multicomponent Na+:H+ antiporter subunit E